LEVKRQYVQWKHDRIPAGGKQMASVFWDLEGILLIYWCSQGPPINSEVYCNTLLHLCHNPATAVNKYHIHYILQMKGPLCERKFLTSNDLERGVGDSLCSIPKDWYTFALRKLPDGC
jgi:hypothetical protein